MYFSFLKAFVVPHPHEYWESAVIVCLGVPGEKPHKHRENMQSPHRKADGGWWPQDLLAVMQPCWTPRPPSCQSMLKKSRKVMITRLYTEFSLHFFLDRLNHNNYLCVRVHFCFSASNNPSDEISCALVTSQVQATTLAKLYHVISTRIN